MKTISDHEWEECCWAKALLAKISYAANKVSLKRETEEQRKYADLLDHWIKVTEPWRGEIKLTTDGDPLGNAS
jgi:hypothetical protein